MKPDHFKSWRKSMGPTQSEAGDVLGISRGWPEGYSCEGRRPRKGKRLMRNGKMGTFDASSGRKLDTTTESIARNETLIAGLSPLVAAYEAAIAQAKSGNEKPA